ncbi:hypothetical protein [Mucilaginibacter sp. HD30]
MNIEKHRHHYFDDLQISSQAFYQHVQDTIAGRRYPEVKCSRRNMSEDGIFSDRREYLVVSRKRHQYLICAAPFGTSFFISYWLRETESIGAQVAARLPLVGSAIAKRAETKTLFQWDTEILFKESITNVIEDTVKQLAGTRAYRQMQDAAGN